MVPSLGDLLATQAWVARRYARSPACDRARLAEALEEAAHLSRGRTEDEPAALLFVLLRRGNAIPGTWDRMPTIFAKNHAANLGVKIELPRNPVELENLMLAIAGKLLTFEEVRARLYPRT